MKKISIEERRRKLTARKRYSAMFLFIVVPLFLVFLISFYFLQNAGILNIDRENLQTAVTIIGSMCLLVAFITSYISMNMLFRPLKELSKASREVANGNYQVRVASNSSIEEVRHTVDNFNFMVKELDSVEMMRNDFIANVSHEFKTPLAAISGYATLLQDEDLSREERQACIRKLIFNTEKLNDLTGNILQLSKLENQNTMPEATTFRLDEQLREAIVTLEPKWSKKNTELDIELDEMLYTGQKELLSHVWQNLIGNAIKFTQEGGMVSISLKQENDRPLVVIKDNGIGMDEQTRKHIFEKFYQGDTSRRGRGNGLGLALCKAIIDQCGGEIVVESEPGQGASFSVSL